MKLFGFVLLLGTVKAGDYIVEVVGKLKCGNQIATGVLDLYNSDDEYITNFLITREFNNTIQLSREFDDKPTEGRFLVQFRTPCGVISNIGKCCENVVTIPVLKHGRFSVFVAVFSPEVADLLALIKEEQSKLVCNDEDHPHICRND